MEGTLNKNQGGKGILITFEGIDGSGKSTQIRKLKSFIKKNNIKNFIFTREPGGSELGNKVKNLLINNNNNSIISKEAQILLLIAARYEHYEKLIAPLLKKNKIVISDRYQDSTFAYQCENNKNLHDLLTNLNYLLFKGFQPGLTILLDINPNVSLKRISKRKTNNAFDKKTLYFYKKVRSSYLKLAKKNSRIKVINAEANENDTFNKIINAIFKYIQY